MIKLFTRFTSTPTRRLTLFPTFQFSEFFKDRDRSEIRSFDSSENMNPNYKRIQDAWQKPLEAKRLRRLRLAETAHLKKKEEPTIEKFVVHNKEIEYPTSNLFAIVNINGFQHKVIEDDVVISEHLKEYDINQTIEFETVMLIGTPDFTVIGRPYVRAKVIATVE